LQKDKSKLIYLSFLSLHKVNVIILHDAEFVKIIKFKGNTYFPLDLLLLFFIHV